jgi:hypothetical protein
MVKKVISFSLWGVVDKYTLGAVKNAKIARDIYPGWICRFYVGKSTPREIVGELIDQDNTEVFIMNEEGNWSGMFWRFASAYDPAVSVMLSRDVDCRLGMREKAAVDEWLESDKDFHIMRDCAGHNIPIMGGMWGARNGILENMGGLISSFKKGEYWQVDQQFLAAHIYPHVRNNSFVHDEYFEFEEWRKPFPTARESGTLEGHPHIPLDYVGKALLGDDSLCWGEDR